MWIFSFVTTLIGWLVLAYADYLEETRHQDFLMGVLWVIPVLAGIAYIVMDLIVRRERAATAKEGLINAGKWLLVSGVFGVLIVIAVMNEWWFIKQATGGWENFLNGIEYFLFAVLLTGGVLAVILLWNILRWLFYKIKRHFVI